MLALAISTNNESVQVEPNLMRGDTVILLAAVIDLPQHSKLRVLSSGQSVHKHSQQTYTFIINLASL